jgi:hypothetical protein
MKISYSISVEGSETVKLALSQAAGSRNELRVNLTKVVHKHGYQTGPGYFTSEDMNIKLAQDISHVRTWISNWPGIFHK